MVISIMMVLMKGAGYLEFMQRQANEYDSKGLESLLKRTPKPHEEKNVGTDKGFKVPNNEKLLKDQIQIQHKSYRNRPLIYWERILNKLISKTRYVVERPFGGMKRWFGASIARYGGIEKMHIQHAQEAISHNLKRALGLVRQFATK